MTTDRCLWFVQDEKTNARFSNRVRGLQGQMLPLSCKLTNRAGMSTLLCRAAHLWTCPSLGLQITLPGPAKCTVAAHRSTLKA